MTTLLQDHISTGGRMNCHARELTAVFPRYLHRSLIVMLAMRTLTACSADIPTAPAPPITQPAPVPPVPAPPVVPSTFPPAPGTEVYERSDFSFFAVGSRYVLNEAAGTFDLQYANSYHLLGHYSRTDTVLTLSFDAESNWKATGTLKWGTLTLAYNIVMQMAGFEDGAYTQTSAIESSVPTIFLADLNGGRLVRYTIGNRPSFSPDGTQLLFDRDGRIITVNLADGTERVLASGTSASWSPNGKFLLFTNKDGIAITGADGLDPTVLVRNGALKVPGYTAWYSGYGNAAWSPDGKSIAFEGLGDDDLYVSQVFVMNADGSNPRVLTVGAAPAWSPDGSRIAFWSPYDLGIETIAATGGESAPVASALGNISYRTTPRWSPDGSTIIFTVRSSTLTLPGIWTASTVTNSATMLVDAAYGGAWAPDGRKIAFVRGGNTFIY